MPDWRDELRPGSFRGVAFHTAESGLEGGRRLAVHEYPGSESAPYPEDLGRKARRWSVEAYVIGPDYMARRRALQAALEAPGPGRLAHHFHGELRVAVEGFSLRESTREGGMARFAIAFVEAGANAQPGAHSNTAAVASRAADATTAAAKADFADRFTTAGQPQFVADAAKAVNGDLSGAIAGLAAPSADPAKRAELASLVSAFDADSGTLTGDPAELAGRSAALITGVAALGKADKALGLLRRLTGFGGDLQTVPTNTPTRRVQAANQDAQTGLVNRVTAAEFVRAASQTTPASRDDAAALRDEAADTINAAIDAAADAGDDMSYAALLALRDAAVRDLTDRGAGLPPLIEVTPDGELPALVWAWDLYEDIGRADEIVARNAIPHPAFVPAGRPFEALAE